MIAKKICGIEISKRIISSLKQESEQFYQKHRVIPSLCVLHVVHTEPAAEYVERKKRAALKAGINISVEQLQPWISEPELIFRLEQKNRDPLTHGIIVQLPLPKHLQTQRVLDLVAFHKDVDGLSSHNQELLRHNLPSYLGYPRFTPCAPLAVLEMLQTGKVSLVGKKGDPMYQIFKQIPGIAGVNTIDFNTSESVRAKLTQEADVIVTAVGRPHILTADYVREGAVVIDVGAGTTSSKHHKLDRGSSYGVQGDVHPEVHWKCEKYSTVPGGIGPVTVAMLLSNTVLAARAQTEADMV